MNIVQAQVNGMKTVINIAVTFSTKEKTEYAEGMGFEPKEGKSMMVRGEKFPIYAEFSLDQVQAHEHVAFLGFGETMEQREDADGIFYRIKLEEKGEGKNVNGSITYEVVSVKRGGKMYEPQKGFKLANGSTLETEFTEIYGSKSAKNSTLFHMIRKFIKNGYVTKNLQKWLKDVKTEAPKKVTKTSNKKPKTVTAS